MWCISVFEIPCNFVANKYNNRISIPFESKEEITNISSALFGNYDLKGLKFQSTTNLKKIPTF